MQMIGEVRTEESRGILLGEDPFTGEWGGKIIETCERPVPDEQRQSWHLLEEPAPVPTVSLVGDLGPHHLDTPGTRRGQKLRHRVPRRCRTLHEQRGALLQAGPDQIDHDDRWPRSWYQAPVERAPILLAELLQSARLHVAPLVGIWLRSSGRVEGAPPAGTRSGRWP